MSSWDTIVRASSCDLTCGTQHGTDSPPPQPSMGETTADAPGAGLQQRGAVSPSPPSLDPWSASARRVAPFRARAQARVCVC
eukprot:gene16857-biopygen2275